MNQPNSGSGQKKRRKSFLKGIRPTETMSLQITSMADIFIILLVFLLKSYATGSADISPSSGMVLPKAVATDSPVEALKVEIAENSVLVEGQPVAKIEKFAFASGDVQSNGSSKLLGEALDHQRKRQLLIAKSNTDVKVDARIVVVADQHVPYSTIKTVLASAAIHGYTDFKLAVVNAN